VTDGRLDGKRALVTGASSGIGARLATVFAERGTHLVLVARRRDRLDALADDLRSRFEVKVQVEACDLSDPDAPEALFRSTEGAGLPIDVLVNNAGGGTWEDFVKTPWEALELQLQVNAIALTRLTHLFVPAMIERGHGHVMHVASIGAYTPTPRFSVYAATKAYVRHFSEALDDELKGTGVRTICINPGGTLTEFSERAGQTLTPAGQLAMMSADRCARIAVEKMLAGRRNVVTGVLNSVSMWLLRFVPRAFYPALARFAMETAVRPR
jgi:short-subunit dehydrogenase